MEKAQSNPRWYKLDNAAKLYPAVRSDDWGATYRVACYLDEAINPERLQAALDATLPRFPMYAVSLRRGFFWYYHEKLAGSPRVEEESGYPCRMPDSLDNESFLFRVSYFGARISVEFFHSLADGSGAMTFLKTLAAEYLCLGGAEIPCSQGILDRRARPDPEESEDAFQRYAGSAEGGSFRESQAYELSMEALPPPFLRVTQGSVDAGALSAAAKAKGATITALLVAILQLSIDEIQREEEGIPQRPVKISVPVNMRKYHPSRTLRNFSLFANVALPLSEYPPSLDEAVAAASAAMKKGLEPEALDLMMSMNVGAERNPAMRAVPLFIKRQALRIANVVVGENQFTCALSNLGAVDLPAEMAGKVERFDCILGRPRRANVNCAVVGYGGKVVISLSGTTAGNAVEEGFFRRLSALGLEVAIDRNLGEGDVAAGVAYPPPSEIPARNSRLKAMDRGTGIAAATSSAFLIFLGCLVPAQSVWWPYPVGAILCAWALWRGPRMLPKPKAPYMVFLTEGLCLGYLGLIALMSGDPSWYAAWLLPSFVVAATALLAPMELKNKRPFKKSYLPLAANLILGVLCFPIAALAGPRVSRIFPGIVFFFSLAGLGSIAYRGRKWWKNELKRKMHIK